MSDLLARLIAAGTPPELVGEVARELAMAAARQEVAQEAIEARRAKDRERQDRRRSRDVTECHVTERDTVTEGPLSRPPNENKSNPPTHTPEKQKPARVKGHRLPASWQPASLTGDLGTAVATWPRGAIEREMDRFRDWAASANGPNALKLDWQAAWRNWLRKAVDDGRYPPGGKVPAPPGAPNDYLATMLAKQAQNA